MAFGRHTNLDEPSAGCPHALALQYYLQFKPRSSHQPSSNKPYLAFLLSSHQWVLSWKPVRGIPYRQASFGQSLALLWATSSPWHIVWGMAWSDFRPSEGKMSSSESGRSFSTSFMQGMGLVVECNMPYLRQTRYISLNKKTTQNESLYA